MTTDYLTPDEVASQLHVSRQVVYNWINDGRLRAVKAGRTLRIPHYALEAFLEPVHVGDISTGGIEPEGSMHHERFTAAAQAVAEAAGSEVRTRQHIQMEVEHVLWALLQQPDGILQQVLQRLGIDPHLVAQQLDQALAKLPSDSTLQPSRQMVAISARLAQIIQRAEELASQLPELQIDNSHVFLAICEEVDGVSAQILHSLGVTPERLRVVLLDIHAAHQAAAPPAATHRSTDWEQRIEQQLTRIETELVTIRSMLSQPTSSDTV
jgi:excisionase family DNA binding protein